ncbi:MAG: hypothetical protein V2I37_08805 [Marinilabiliaceae bacterium]|jgi:hypothetical protein|nr:hypothetical protein [Marinilabiliaceae bacterium]
MNKFLIAGILFFITVAISLGQTKQASKSAVLRNGKHSVELINGLNIVLDFRINDDMQYLWVEGSTKNNPLFITEYIPLTNPEAIGIEIGKSYKLDNLFASIEYKILEIEDNKVTRIWYRVVALSDKLPEEAWI